MNNFYLYCLFIPLLSVSYADTSMHKHWCYKPTKPVYSILFSFHEDYKKDLVTYQQCLKNYIQEQNQGILIHQENIDKTFKELELLVHEITG